VCRFAAGEQRFIAFTKALKKSSSGFVRAQCRRDRIPRIRDGFVRQRLASGFARRFADIVIRITHVELLETVSM
jgi:hypothetical protein